MATASKMRLCYYRRRLVAQGHASYEVRSGYFHQWSQDFEELRDGVGMFPVAIVEDQLTKAVVLVPAQNVCFGMKATFADEMEVRRAEIA